MGGRSAETEDINNAPLSTAAAIEAIPNDFMIAAVEYGISGLLLIQWRYAGM